jgi:hypothetical protein
MEGWEDGGMERVNVLDFWDGRRDAQGNMDISEAVPLAIAALPRGGEIFYPEGDYAPGVRVLGDRGPSSGHLQR